MQTNRRSLSIWEVCFVKLQYFAGIYSDTEEMKHMWENRKEFKENHYITETLDGKTAVIIKEDNGVYVYY